MLPFANNCLDYLVRTNISSQTQGRAWGLIGFLSQLGYVIAYAFSGILADGLAKRMGIGVGRGAAMLILLSGGLLLVLAAGLWRNKDVRSLESAQERELVRDRLPDWQPDRQPGSFLEMDEKEGQSQ